MYHLEQVEWGLPAREFVHQIGGDRHPAPASVPRNVHFHLGSPWRGNRKAGECLTWRGRNFMEAFAAINQCELKRATIIDLLAHHCIESPCPDTRVGTATAGERVEYFHFVCEASEGSLLQVGGSAVALHVGDLWRVDRGDRRTIVHGGCEGGRHLVLELMRHAGASSDMMVGDENFHGVPE